MGLNKREYTAKQTVITAENLNEIQDCIIELENGEVIAKGNLSLVETLKQIYNPIENNYASEWNRVFKRGNMYLAATGRGSTTLGGILYSGDGYNYESTNVTGAYGDIAFGNSTYVAGRVWTTYNDSNTKFVYSRDGYVWHESGAVALTGAAPTTKSAMQIVYGGGAFVAVLIAHESTSNNVFTSKDGVTWTAATLTSTGKTYVRIGNPIYDGARFVIPAIQTNGSIDLFTSSNGSNFTVAHTYAASATGYIAPSNHGIMIDYSDGLYHLIYPSNGGIVLRVIEYFDTQDISRQYYTEGIFPNLYVCEKIYNISHDLYFGGTGSNDANYLYKIENTALDIGNWLEVIDVSDIPINESYVQCFCVANDVIYGVPRSEIGSEKEGYAINVYTSPDCGLTWRNGIAIYSLRQDNEDATTTRILLNLFKTNEGDLQLGASDVNAIPNPVEKQINDILKFNGNDWIAADGGDLSNVDDIRADGVSLLNNKIVNLRFGTTYNSSSNKIATMADITNAIGRAIAASY